MAIVARGLGKETNYYPVVVTAGLGIGFALSASSAKYTDLKWDEWKQVRPPILSEPLFGPEPTIEVIEARGQIPEEVFEEAEVVDVPAFLEKQERVTEARLAKEKELAWEAMLLEDEELVLLLAMSGEL